MKSVIKETMRGVLSGGKVIVAGSEAESLVKGHSRKKGRLELEEAAGLLETGKIEIKNPCLWVLPCGGGEEENRPCL